MNLPDLLPFAPRGVLRFAAREYLVVVCASDAAAIRAALPRPLEPDGSNTVHVRFIATRDPAGAGSYVETDLVIPALFNSSAIDYTAQRYAEHELPAFVTDAGLKAAWPRRPGRSRLLFTRECASAVLEIGGKAIMLAEMGHGKHGFLDRETSACSESAVRHLLAGTQVNLKRVPGADGRASVAQLVGVGIGDIQVKSAWCGAARLHRSAARVAPITEFALQRAILGINFVADVTIGSAQVLFDYKREARRPLTSVLGELAAGFGPRLQTQRALLSLAAGAR